MKTYIVTSKGDEYGNFLLEIVETTKNNAEEYYTHKEIDDSDIGILKKYLDFIPYEQEKERSSDRRFYGME